MLLKGLDLPPRYVAQRERETGVEQVALRRYAAHNEHFPVVDFWNGRTVRHGRGRPVEKSLTSFSVFFPARQQ